MGSDDKRIEEAIPKLGSPPPPDWQQRVWKEIDRKRRRKRIAIAVLVALTMLVIGLAVVLCSGCT